MLLRLVAAVSCFSAAVFAVTHSFVDVRDLDNLAAQHPEQRFALLAEAHLLHPRDTSIGLQLGIEFERLGDRASAEAILLQAARFDHQYQPAWTLANFYFRGEDQDQFWTWAARAASVSYDVRPLLRLAVVWAPEPRLLIPHLGNRPELLRPYLDLLLGQGRFNAAGEIAGLLRAYQDPSDLPRLNAPSIRNIPSEVKH